MKKKIYPVLAALAATMCLALSACSSGSGGPEVIQMTADEKAEVQSITVTGRDTVLIEPDMAEMSFNVITTEEDAVTAQEENAKVVDAIITYLKGQGMSDTSIKTSGYSLSTNYEWRNGEQQFLGYDMIIRITVSDVPIDKAGIILAGSIAAGATGVRSVNYYSSEYDTAYDEALRKAVAQAENKAQTLAEAGGNTLGDILQMEEYSDSQQGRYISSNISIDAGVFGNGDGGDDDYIPVMAGEMEVSADVKVVFELIPSM